MFVPNFEEPIPGYTGHRQEKMESNKDLQQPTMPRKQIPGKSDIIAFYSLSNLFIFNFRLLWLRSICQIRKRLWSHLWQDQLRLQL